VVVQQGFSALSPHDALCHRIGVLLVRIRGLSDPTGELDTAALLHHVRGLVSFRMQGRCSGERDVGACRERLGAHCLRSGRGPAILMGSDVANVVVAKGTLDLLDVR
jgi:hypothetical protein